MKAGLVVFCFCFSWSVLSWLVVFRGLGVLESKDRVAFVL